MWRIRHWIHKVTGFRGWESSKRYRSFRCWLVWAWNEYDDWLYNGIHGLRILGAEFDVYPRWLDRLCWRFLPIFRFFIRRKERE